MKARRWGRKDLCWSEDIFISEENMLEASSSEQLCDVEPTVTGRQENGISLGFPSSFLKSIIENLD